MSLSTDPSRSNVLKHYTQLFLQSASDVEKLAGGGGIVAGDGLAVARSAEQVSVVLFEKPIIAKKPLWLSLSTNIAPTYVPVCPRTVDEDRVEEHRVARLHHQVHSLQTVKASTTTIQYTNSPLYNLNAWRNA